MPSKLEEARHTIVEATKMLASLNDELDRYRVAFKRVVLDDDYREQFRSGDEVDEVMLAALELGIDLERKP